MRFTARTRTERFAQFAQRVFGLPREGKDNLVQAREGLGAFVAFLSAIGCPTGHRKALQPGSRLRGCRSRRGSAAWAGQNQGSETDGKEEITRLPNWPMRNWMT